MENPEELPQWFMDLFLDFLSDVNSNMDKFSNTGSAKIVDEDDSVTKRGYALHNQSEERLTFVGIQSKQKSDESEYCHIKTDFPNNG